MTHFYATENANPLRGLYSLSERAPLAYENARDTVAKFINTHEAAEIVFTRNASENLNLVAYSRHHFHCGWSPVYSTHEGRCSGF